MALLTEYALTPNVFNVRSYSSNEFVVLNLQNLKDMMLNEALVRDLRDGEWLRLFCDGDESWHRRGKELLKKLIKQNRLNRFPPALPVTPATNEDWFNEALASHTNGALEGVITTSTDLRQPNGNPPVYSIDQLTTADFRRLRDSSVRLNRTIAAYEENLRLVLDCANSIMFIDPHIDPTLSRYKDFSKFIQRVCNRKCFPLIEIHRVCYVGSGKNREFPPVSEWKTRFKNGISHIISKVGLTIEVFIWDNFHDRYIISDLVGISIPNGLDVSHKPNDMTTWTRLSRSDRDDIQREFDIASKRHNPPQRFLLP